jgi:hypothetical protein
MKRALLLLLLVSSSCQAHTQPPITAYVQSSETVCIAKATAIDHDEITFTVEEIIKGEPPTFLTLHVVSFASAEITLNSEWLLASTRGKGSSNSTLGWATEGDYGWVNARTERIAGKIFLAGNFGSFLPKLSGDTSKGLTMEQLRELSQIPIRKQ